MSCSCSGSQRDQSIPGSDGPLPSSLRLQGSLGSRSGMALEPFPRQTLVGSPGGIVSYYSEIYDSKDWKSVAWWLQCYGSLPAVAGVPLTMYIETGETVEGPWEELGTQIIGGGEVYTGVVNDPGSLMRFRLDVQTDEIATARLCINVRIHSG